MSVQVPPLSLHHMIITERPKRPYPRRRKRSALSSPGTGPDQGLRSFLQNPLSPWLCSSWNKSCALLPFPSNNSAVQGLHDLTVPFPFFARLEHQIV